MANLDKIKIKTYQIDLGEVNEDGSKKIRNLRFDMNAFAALEEHYGSMESVMKVIEKSNVKGMIALLWAGLLHEDENLTVKQVGSMLDFSDIIRLSEVISSAMKSSMPDAQVEGAQPKNGKRQSSPKKAQ